MRQALTFRQLTPEVTFFQHTAPALTEQHVARLTTWDIRVVTGPVESVEVADDLNVQVVSAAAAGAAVGAAISGDLVAEDTELTIKVLAPTCSEERYGEGKRVWSGKASLHVETTTADLPAGTALDVGTGGGGDAIWLASHGSSSTWCPRSTCSCPGPHSRPCIASRPRPSVRAGRCSSSVTTRPTWTSKLRSPCLPHLMFTAEDAATLLDPSGTSPRWPPNARPPTRRVGRSRSPTRCCARCDVQPNDRTAITTRRSKKNGRDRS
ncbi:hypothetical protein AB0L26_03545 [Streptomyces nondiastaticus]|uniref:hypothetical protein n=1 Tax=Streptomyces nondiastaticus TaxID=3154512 RepID=UPI00342CEB67